MFIHLILMFFDGQRYGTGVGRLFKEIFIGSFVI